MCSPKLASSGNFRPQSGCGHDIIGPGILILLNISTYSYKLSSPRSINILHASILSVIISLIFDMFSSPATDVHGTKPLTAVHRFAKAIAT